MKVILQRVSKASVDINYKTVAQIGSGILILLGVAQEDTKEDIKTMCKKITELRIFEDKDKKMNLSLKDINGEALIVPNFTLYANCKKGKRPSFCNAAKPDFAKNMFKAFCEEMNSLGLKNVQTGEFGADMQVNLINNGPVTIILDSKEL